MKVEAITLYTFIIVVLVVAGLLYFEVPSKIADSMVDRNIEISYKTETVLQYGEGDHVTIPKPKYSFLIVDLAIKNSGYEKFYTGLAADLVLKADNIKYYYCSAPTLNSPNFVTTTLLNGDSWNGSILYEIPFEISAFSLLVEGDLANYKIVLNPLD